MTPRAAYSLFVAAALILAAVGIPLGEGLSMGVIVCSPLVLGGVLLCRRLDRHRLGLAEIFVIAVLLRWVCAAFVHLVVYSSQPGLFAPDEMEYEYSAKFVVAYYQGLIPEVPARVSAPGLVWVMSVWYWLFGPGPLLPKLFVGFIGGWTAVFTALLATYFLPAKVARRAGFLAAVFPSLVLWSSLQLKDPWTLFGVELALVCALALRERFRLWLVGLLALALVPIGTNRPYELVFLAVAIVGGFVLTGRRSLVRNLAIGTLLGGVLIFAIQSLNALEFNYLGMDLSTVEQINAVRAGYTTNAGSAINIESFDTSTPLGMALWTPLGLAYLFLAPIPFTGTSTISLATSPEMVVWYFLLPSAVRGLLRLRRAGRLGAAGPILVFGLVAASSWAVTVTNVGSLYRYRAQVLFVPLILIALDQIARAQEAPVRRLTPWGPGRPPLLPPPSPVR